MYTILYKETVRAEKHVNPATFVANPVPLMQKEAKGCMFQDGGLRKCLPACGRHHDGRTYPSVNQAETEIDPCHNTAGRNDVHRR